MPPIRRIGLKQPFWSGRKPLTRPVQQPPFRPGRGFPGGPPLLPGLPMPGKGVKPVPPRHFPPDFKASGPRPEFEAVRTAARAQKAALRRLR